MNSKLNRTAPLFYGLAFSTFILLPFAARGADLTLAQAQAGAAKGDAEAEYSLGKAYYQGQGLPRDYAKAFDLFQKAAHQGNVKAQNNLATMYQLGLGVAKDPVQAAAWYRKAAEQGNPISEYNLAYMLISGQGTAPDPKQAVMWYEKAAKQGFALAQVKMGRLCERGDGVPVDLKHAAAWYKRRRTREMPKAKRSWAGFIVPAWRRKRCRHGFQWIILSAAQGCGEGVVLDREMRPVITKDQFELASRRAAAHQAQQPVTTPAR